MWSRIIKDLAVLWRERGQTMRKWSFNTLILSCSSKTCTIHRDLPKVTWIVCGRARSWSHSSESQTVFSQIISSIGWMPVCWLFCPPAALSIGWKTKAYPSRCSKKFNLRSFTYCAPNARIFLALVFVYWCMSTAPSTGMSQTWAGGGISGCTHCGVAASTGCLKLSCTAHLLLQASQSSRSISQQTMCPHLSNPAPDTFSAFIWKPNSVLVIVTTKYVLKTWPMGTQRRNTCVSREAEILSRK